MMNTLSKTIIGWAVAGVAVAGTLIACQDPDYATPTPATTGATASARALFVNASPDSPALNFLVENMQVAQSLGLGQSSNYVNIPVGNIQVRAKAASGVIGGVLGSNDILFRAGATNQTNFGSAAGTNYTIFVTDTIRRPAPTTPAGATNPGGPQFLTVTDVLTTTATSGANVRVFNLSPDAAISGTAVQTTVSVRLSVPTSTTGIPPSVGSFTSRAYRAVTASTFTNVPANTYNVDVFSGTSTPNSATATVSPLTSTTVNLENTKFYTLYVQGVGKKRTLSVGRVLHN